MTTPPRTAQLLLRLVLRDPDLSDGLLGDLEEGLADLTEAGIPPRHPGLWYWRAILGLSVRFAFSSLPRNRRARIASPTEGTKDRPPIFEVSKQDLHHAYRSLRRNPGLATLAVVIIGLGVGACTTVFSVANALLLRPLPFEGPEELVFISNGALERGEPLAHVSVQVAHLWTLQAESRLLSDVAGYYLFDGPGDHALTDSGEPERLTRVSVTGNFLPMLGVQPQIGRLFSAEEVQWSGPGAILLTHGFWVRRFGSDPSVVGRSLTINDAPVTVVGVLPASFDFATVFAPGTRIDFLAPFPLSEETDRWGSTLALLGRLRPGATPESAQAEAALLAQRPNEGEGLRNSFHPQVTPLRNHVSGAVRSTVLLLAGAVGLVMLIVCTNLSNLLLARGAALGKEMAIRAALGAGRYRLVRQLLTESGVLALVGSALGLGLALAGTRVLSRLDASIPLLNQVRIDGTAVAFTIGLALVTGIVFGLAPAVRLSATALHDVLKECGRSHSTGWRGGRVRSALVASQVALCCMLLVGAGLLIRSFLLVVDVEMGYQTRGAIAVRVDPNTRSPWGEFDLTYYEEALRRVRAAPEIEAAGLTDVLPTAFNRTWGSFRAGERWVANAYVRVVSEGYLEAMGLSLMAGRDLSSQDDGRSRRAVLINEVMARRLWPGEDPVGRTLYLDESFSDMEVVGVVRGTRYIHPEQEPAPEIFFSMRQNPFFGRMYVVARGSNPPAQLSAAVHDALRPLDPNLPLTEVTVIQDLLDMSLSSRRFLLSLLGGFAGFALILAALGLYGVISFSVSQRTQELGIRSALGASPGELQKRVLTDTLALALAGMVLGIPAAWALGRVLQGLLFGVSSSDPPTFLAVTALVISVAALAGYMPARRATRIDPVRALQAETGSSS